MKGLLFQKPLEFNIQTEGESWNQGDAISGKLSIKNHSNESLKIENLNISLGWGDLKKVRAKSPEAFDILERAKIEPITIAAQSTHETEWKFQTKPNSPITDNSSSVFLLYGLGDVSEQLGMLQLKFLPAPINQEFIKAITIQFRFVVKNLKAVKNGMQIKLAPPAARSFATVEHLVMRFKKDDTELNIDYEFQVKNLTAAPGTQDVKKLKKELSQTLVIKNLWDSAGRPRHQLIESSVREAVDLVESKVSY